MTCVKQQFLTVDFLCSFEIFHSLHFDEVFQFFLRSRRKLTEQSQLSPQTVEALSQDLGSFCVTLFGEGEAKVYLSRATEIACKCVSHFPDAAAERESRRCW